MFRTIIWFLYFGLSLILLLPFLLVGKYYEKKGMSEKLKNYAFKKARNWSNQLNFIAGGKIEVIGEENIPENDSFLIVSNHQSNFDIPILLGNIKRPLAFIAKIETKKIPLLKTWMEFMKCIFMDRNDFRQSVKAINEGAKLLEEGYNFVIFPEGTRSKDGLLQDFKPGSIKMAMKAKKMILPVTISGSIGMMAKGRVKITPADVKVIVHEPIMSDDENFNDSLILTQKIKSIIESGL
ncbi:MAG: 1-acyl-sn-glycerol-3-phosphate acyltransferase [Clostridiales bacterium]|nr:1-acyl-sn-glycerol-3-phosphate acyltransferase [Clostridiales bacterium]